ncbi:DedA family protein [Peribacillus kribbensis]|uniref:DedA family protein n=1 Tax=Peribacillus kribbensis TaxID=356658 RepID=UPI00041901F2|nr:DedA family protein [Peribacillus kribbensis]
MHTIKNFIDFILHLDTHILSMVKQYGGLTYALLFLILFLETGLVIVPFLPGDSVLFVAGSIAAQGSLNLGILAVIFFLGAVLGDTVNYHIGAKYGVKVFESRKIKLINKSHLQRAQEFYDRKGPIVIVLARFIPIIRTFAPFAAGIGGMAYKKFLIYNLSGGALWVLLMTFSGFFFGNIPLVKNHFSLVTIAIILISMVPVIKGLIHRKLSNSKIQ